MELDQFRDVDLVIDYANYSFIEKQFVSQGDYKGRTLTVQVTNNGVVGEVPGLALNLNWHNEASGLTDLSAFSVLDKANSIYRIEYPQHMMTPGRVIASIQVLQNGKSTFLKSFTLTVQQLAGQAVGVVQQAEFSALVAVLAEANGYKSDIDSLAINKASKNDLTQTENRLNNIIVQNTGVINESLNSKVDKNGNEQITMPMLSQTVKEAMTGGSVAVVDEDSVNTTNLVNNSATSVKRTRLGESGYIIGTKPLMVDFKNNKLYISKGVTHRVYNRATRFDLPEQTLDFGPSLSGNGIESGVRLLRLVYRTSVNSLVFIAHNGPQYFTEFDVDLGCILRDLSGNGETGCYLNGEYDFTGLANSTYDTPLLISNTPLNFDRNRRKLVVPRNASLVYQGVGTVIAEDSEVEVDFPDIAMTTKYIYDTSAKTIYNIPYRESYPKSHMLLAVMRETSDDLIVSVNGQYTIDGVYQYAKKPEVKYVGSDPLSISVVNRKMTFPSFNGNGSARLFVDDEVFEIPQESAEIDIPSVAGNLVKLFFNRQAKTFRVASWAGIPERNECIVAVTRLIPPYTSTLNGEYLFTDDISNAKGLDILTSTLEDSVSSWWTYPLAKRFVGFRDRSYLSYTDSLGYSGVISIDNNSGEITKRRLKKSDIDDHNAVAVDIMPDGKIIAAYSGGHNTDKNIHVRISSKRESVTDFEDEVSVSVGEITSYAQIFFKNNLWWIFFRMSNTAWGYIISENGKTWSSPVKLINGHPLQYYVKFCETKDDKKLKLVMYSNPNSGDTNIRAAIFDCESKVVSTLDGIPLGSSLVSKDNVPIVLPNEDGKEQRLLDVAVTDPQKTIIGYVTFTTDSDGEYKVIEVGKQAYKLADAGRSFYLGSKYYNGLAFVDDKTVILSRGNDGRDYVEKYLLENESWEKTMDIFSSELAIRPTRIINQEKVVIQTGYFNENNFNDFLTDYNVLDC